MGWRYRKSINLGGGFRVNLSKNGIGYSWGVKGYRVTKTADGRTRQTVSIPGTGISYVEEHGKRSSGQQAGAAQQQRDPMADYTGAQRVTSADANTLRSPEYDELFKEVKRVKLLRTVLIVLAILTVAATPVCVLCLVALAALFIKGRPSIIYEFEDDKQVKWDRFSAAWRAVAASQSLQEITLTATSKNSRKTAGIKNAVDTVKISAGGKLPWYLKTNISPVVFRLQNPQMAVMPDRLLIFGKKQFGALDYSEVKFDISAFGFLEGGQAPTDSEVVKMVWAYSNNDGSPDRRYANNKQYPVLKYGKIIVTSQSGLNIQIICSNESASDALNTIINGPEE